MTKERKKTLNRFENFLIKRPTQPQLKRQKRTLLQDLLDLTTVDGVDKLESDADRLIEIKSEGDEEGEGDQDGEGLRLDFDV